MIPEDLHHKQLLTSVPGPAPCPDVALPFPETDEALVPGVTPCVPTHCPTCHRPWFDPQASAVLDLVVDLHEALSTATAQVGTVRAILEEELVP